MQQYKTTGYSALLILLFCLSSTDGFLEANRRQLQERNIQLNKNDQLINRFIFGNTWQRSSVLKQERRIVPDRDVPLIGESRRQIRDSRLFSASDSRRELDDRRSTNHREERRFSSLDDGDENRRFVIGEGRSRRSVDNSRRQSQEERRISAAREQRQYSNFRVQERRNLAARENDRELRQFDNSRRESFVERREIRSASLARSRDQDRRISTDRQSRLPDVSRNIREREDDSRQNSRRLYSETRDRLHENNSRQVREDRPRETRRISVDREDETRLDNSRKQNRRISTIRREIRIVDRSRDDNSRRVRDSRVDNSRRVSADNDSSRQLDDSRRQSREFRGVTVKENRGPQRTVERREIGLRSVDNSRKIREQRNFRSRTLDESLRLVERRNLENNSRRQIRQFDQEIRVLDRRLTKELDRSSRVASISTRSRDSRLNSDATKRITLLKLSSKDENNNDTRFKSFEPHRYFARSERDPRQSRIAERRMATSFIPTENIEYIPEMKSNLLLNAAKVVLISFLIAQIVTNSSKTKRNWFHDLTNFVTVTKEKVL